MAKAIKKETVWVLTFEVNDYDQHGEYFAAVFNGKPSASDLIDHLQINSSFDAKAALSLVLHILEKGGGRRGDEDSWYNLKEIHLIQTSINQG